MKKMKRLAALFLAVVMVMAMGMTAMAAGGKITVADTKRDATYELYKIFDATSKEVPDEESENKTKTIYSYTIPAESPIDVNNEEFKNVFKTISNGGKTYVERANENVTDEAITTYLKENAANIGIPLETKTSTKDGENVIFNVSKDGYYYVKSSVSNGAAAMVSTVTKDVTIHEKNDMPGWPEDGSGKVADGVTFYEGETVPYTLTYRALNYADGRKVTQYIVKDNPAKGIEIDETSVVIKVGETELDSAKGEYTGTLTSTDGITIPWVYDNGDFRYTTPVNLVITYNATVTDAAAAGIDGLTNTATISYNDEEGTDEHETVYTGQITINKVDGEDSDIKLAATFIIADSDPFAEGATPKYLKYDEDATESKYSWVDSETDATTYTTDATTGQIVISGLKADEYWLVEKEAPAGYNLLNVAKKVEVAVPEEGADTDTLLATSTVENVRGAQLPSTGGIGTTIFYVVGGILVLGAAVLLITKKRMSARNE